MGDPGWSGWISVPEGFRRVQTIGRKAHGDTWGTGILEGRYKVSVGPFEFTDPKDGKPDYFSISVERPIEDGGLVVGALDFPLAYVSEEKLRAPADEVVSVDPETHVVTYDLGNSVFKFQLPVD